MSAGTHWRVALALAVSLAGVLDARAQPVPTAVDRDLAALYQSLEEALKTSNGIALRAMMVPGADLAAAQAFIAQEVLPGATHAIIRERDREAIAGASPEGFHVLLDAFVEFGQRGSARTWRLDVVRRPGGGGGASGWAISAPERLASVEGLHRLTLDRTKQFRVSNLRVTSEDLTIVIPSGVAFAAVTQEGPTAFVLIGRGEMVFSPKQDSERGQVRIVAGDEVMRSAVEGAFLRLNPYDVPDRLSKGSLTEMPVDARELRRAEALFAEEIPKSFSLDLSDLSRDQWSLVPPSSDFIAEMRTSRFGTLTYARSGNEPEDITVFDRKRRRNIAVYASAAKLASRGSRFYSEEDDADYDVLHYAIQTYIDPRREWIDGRVEIRLRARSVVMGTLTLRLAEPLVVRSVTAPGLGRLLTLRVKGQNSVIVNLPRIVKRDEELVLTVVYAGRLAGASPEREALALGQEQIVQDAISVAVEPRLIYTNRSYWYPQAPSTDFATATLRLSIPEDVSCVASGTPAAGSPVRIDGVTPLEKRKLYVFVVDRPARYLAVLLSRLEPVVVTSVPRPATVVPTGGPAAGQAAGPGAGPGADPGASSGAGAGAARDGRGAQVSSPDAPGVGGALPVTIMANPRQEGRARAMQGHVRAVWSAFAEIIGELPYPSFTLALVDDPLPGGHSPAYFALLHQPLPTTPYTWRNDPVAFDNFPQFFLAHEIAHQFWGNAVGWENYHEQWISEGFAQYFAVLYAERTQGRSGLDDVLRQLRRTAAANSRHGPIWLGYRLGHIQGDGRIFRALVYNKGALVLHMLRRQVGEDAFFRGLRRFYRDSRYRKVGTSDVQRAFEAESGQSLGRFFERWIMGSDLPTIRVGYRVEPSGDGSLSALSAVSPGGVTAGGASTSRGGTGATGRAANAGGAAPTVVVRLEQIGALVFDVPVTVTLVYASGPPEEVVVRMSEKVVETRLPLRGPLRAVELNRDDAALVEIARN